MLVLWPLDEVDQLNEDLVDEQAGPVCSTATQLSGLRNTRLFCYCTFFFFSSGAWSYTAIVWLLLSFTSFYEVFSDSVLVNMLLLRDNVCISWSSTWLCYPTLFPLPTLLLLVSICDLIQFTNIGENYQWRGSTRPVHSFSNSKTRDQFSLLRELQMEPLGTWSCNKVDSKIPRDVGAAGAVSRLQSCMSLHGTAWA